MDKAEVLSDFGPRLTASTVWIGSTGLLQRRTLNLRARVVWLTEMTIIDQEQDYGW
jgi:hypothetical protein